MVVPVFFADFRAESPERNSLAKIRLLLESAGLSRVVRKGDLCAIKLHFGEEGNETFISPVLARAVADAVAALGAKPFFADTNTLYSGARSNAVDHLRVAEAHGYLKAVCGAPVIIADGLRGSDWREVEVNLPRFKSAKIATAFVEADSMLVLSHVKGHMMSGFGGAIKNLAMGCASPEGKREQHCITFRVHGSKCVSCGACAEVCPVAAASHAPGAPARIQKSACIGCGECATRCPAKAIGMDWDADIVEFTEKMTEYAYGAVKNKEGRLLYLNFVKSVVPDCDCSSWSDLPVVADQGMLACLDPVAIDQASFDLVKAAPAVSGSALDGKVGPGDDKFAALHPETRGFVQLEYGERIGLGSRSYELTRV